MKLVSCLIAALALSSCATQTQPKLRPELSGVYNSARAIEGALAVGVSYIELENLIRKFSTEMLLARDEAKFDPAANKDLSPVLSKYADLLMMYKDSATVWGLEIDKKTSPDLSAIAAKYGMPSAIREEPRLIGTYKYKETTADYEAIRQTIWDQAGKLHEQQIAIVYGYPVERVKGK